MTQPNQTYGKYRKRPVVVEAMRYDGTEPSLELRRWLPERIWAFSTGPYVNAPGTMEFRIHTLEGWMTANPGDWIIKGVEGEFYPCKPDIFEATYEPA
jgi:hypothetical protein